MSMPKRVQSTTLTCSPIRYGLLPRKLDRDYKSNLSKIFFNNFLWPQAWSLNPLPDVFLLYMGRAAGLEPEKSKWLTQFKYYSFRNRKPVVGNTFLLRGLGWAYAQHCVGNTSLYICKYI
jgi:hypothetical protein